MGSIVANFLASLAISLLKHLYARADLGKTVRQEMEIETLRWAKRALEWKAAHPVGGGDPFSDFRVRDPDKRPEPLPGRDPGKADP